MDYLSSLSDPGRDLVAVEVFSGKATLVTSFRPSSKHNQHVQHEIIRTGVHSTLGTVCCLWIEDLDR